MAIYKYDGQQWIDYNQYDTALEVVQKSKNNILYLGSLHDSGATEEELNRIRNQIIEIQSELSSLEMRTEGIEETLPQKQDALSAGLAIGLYGTTIAVKLQDIAAKLDSVPSGAAITESSADFIRVNNIMYYKTQTIVGGMTTYAYEELTNSDLTERIVAQIPTDFKIDESGRLVLIHDSNVIGMGVEIGGVGVTINAPATATQGTLTATQLGILEASETNYIMFNHEKYYLMDKQHTSGSLTYSHVGADNQVNHIKTFTITLSNLTWVLIDTEIGKSEPAITIVDILPEANEEEFEKHKIYQQGSTLKFIGGDVPENPPISLKNTLSTTRNGTTSVAVGSNIYIFGGDTKNTRLSTIYKYDTLSDTITTLSITLPKAIYGAVSVAVGSNIYIIGGYYQSGNAHQNTIQKFNTTSNVLTTLTTTLPSGMAYSSAAAVGGAIYILGGYGDSWSYFDTIEKFDISNETITTLSTTLPKALFYTSAAAVGNNIYIFGGQDSNANFVNTIYELSLSMVYSFKTIVTE